MFRAKKIECGRRTAKCLYYLRQSIAMGQKLSKDQFSVGEYHGSGAAKTLDDYISNAVDVARQEILATVGQAISWDENGLRARKWNADRTGYEPQQMWMNNNQLLFTDNNWESVKTAFGKINVGGNTMYGLVGEVVLGDLVFSKNLIARSEKEHSGISEFRVDANGAKLYNSTFELATGENRIGLVPQIGIVAGLKQFYEFDPSTGEIIGIKTNKGYVAKLADLRSGEKPLANFWADMYGGVYGQGDFYANNLYFNDGGDVKTLLSQANKKISKDLLDLGNIKLDGVTGNISMTGSIDMDGSITMGGNINLSKGIIKWGANNIPNKKQYAASMSGPWHPVMQSGDIYCCDWDYEIDDWGSPYKFVGTDGRPGSDANVPKYVTETVIGKGMIQAPQIYANDFSVYPQDNTTVGGSFNLYGNFNGRQDKYMSIAYGTPVGPDIQFYSPKGAYATWSFPVTTYTGVVDFTNADVRGVTACFG